MLTDFLTTGTYDRNREFHLTNTPSMDILISSNLERYLFELTGRDSEAVSGFMKALSAEGCYSISAEALSQVRQEFSAYHCDDVQTLATIGEVHRQTGYVMDTHTAVAYFAAEAYRQETKDDRPMLVVSTASPFKFAGQCAYSTGLPGSCRGVRLPVCSL